MKIPFSDISFDKEEIDAVREVMESGWPSRGEVSAEFESALAKYLNSNVALVNSGSSALLCSLLAYGIKAGDTVLVSDFTFIATASIPAILGSEIRTIDCDDETFNLSAGEMMLRVPGQAIIVTDVAGLPTEITEMSYPYIEDAAEALGAEHQGIKVGARNHLTCFSFNITKSLTTIEGGAIASKNEERIEKCRSASNYGRTDEQYVHDRLGLNCRITDVASALGLIQLRKLDKNLARRKEIADRYRKELPMFQFQKIPSYVTKSTNFMMIGLCDFPMIWINWFRQNEIDARRVFLPIHAQPCFPGLPKCPNSQMIWEKGICLPIFNGMSDAQVEYVIEVARINEMQETSNYKWQFARQAREKLERSSKR